MVKLDHDDVAQNADMGSVYDRLAEQFERQKQTVEVRYILRPWSEQPSAQSMLAADMVAEMQDDGWDNDCC